MDELEFEAENMDPFEEERRTTPLVSVFTHPNANNTNVTNVNNTFTNNAGCIGSGIQFTVNGNSELIGDLILTGDNGCRYKIRIDSYGNLYTEIV